MENLLQPFINWNEGSVYALMIAPLTIDIMCTQWDGVMSQKCATLLHFDQLPDIHKYVADVETRTSFYRPIAVVFNGTVPSILNTHAALVYPLLPT